jgi:hypothetical protein
MERFSEQAAAGSGCHCDRRSGHNEKQTQNHDRHARTTISLGNQKDAEIPPLVGSFKRMTEARHLDGEHSSCGLKQAMFAA